MPSLALIREPGHDYGAPINQHDTGYKYLLSNKATFLQSLRSFIQADWVEELRLENISLVQKSFILHDFRHQEADLVYRIRLADEDIYFYMLLELQSTVDPMMPFRLLMYMVEIWRNFIFNESKSSIRARVTLPVIVPCVLYNGKNK